VSNSSFTLPSLTLLSQHAKNIISSFFFIVINFSPHSIFDNSPSAMCSVSALKAAKICPKNSEQNS